MSQKEEKDLVRRATGLLGGWLGATVAFYPAVVAGVVKRVKDGSGGLDQFSSVMDKGLEAGQKIGSDYAPQIFAVGLTIVAGQAVDSLKTKNK